MAIGAVSGISQQIGKLSAGKSASQLTSQQQQEVNRLKAIDSKVRAHEEAHMAAGAGLAGSASYQYARGPDGRQYAVAGEVSISLPSGGTPESIVAQARQVVTAALAPEDPSPQDRAVAAAAEAMASQARQEISDRKPTGIDSAAGLRAYARSAATEAGNATSIDEYA